MVNLAQIDLNLLLVLHTVLEERSAAAAAKRLHVTPPAISNSLARLRGLLGDPLVVRSGRGLTPTPRALELMPHLRAAIESIQRVVVGEQGFDPATTTRTFALTLSDAHQVCDLPRIARAFATQMPRAGLRIVSVDHHNAVDGLASGEVDAAIAPAHPLQPGHHACDLYEEASAFVVRRDHPLAGAPLTREAFMKLRHIDLHLALGRGGIGHRAASSVLGEHGLRRDVAVTVPSFLAAAFVASTTDFAAGMPLRLAEALAASAPLAVLTVPGMAMTFRMQLQWHDRTDRDPGARAFRSLIVEALAPAAQPARARSTTRSRKR
jgi:DNA-binding transcriptional LysR family regulator